MHCEAISDACVKTYNLHVSGFPIQSFVMKTNTLRKSPAGRRQEVSHVACPRRVLLGGWMHLSWFYLGSGVSISSSGFEGARETHAPSPKFLHFQAVFWELSSDNLSIFTPIPVLTAINPRRNLLPETWVPSPLLNRHTPVTKSPKQGYQ